MKKICIWKTILCGTNDLDVAQYKHKFLSDIIWNYAVFLRLINICLYTYTIGVLHCFTTLLLKARLKRKRNVKKKATANIL